MADFASWVTACEEALGWPPETFLKAYMANRNEANQVAIEASPVASGLCELLRDAESWDGSFTQLLGALAPLATEEQKNDRGWPKRANELSKIVRRVMPNLRSQGIEMEDLPRTSKTGRRVRLYRREKAEQSLSLSSPLSPPPQEVPGTAIPGDEPPEHESDACHHRRHQQIAVPAPENGTGVDSDKGDNDRTSNSPDGLLTAALDAFDGELVPDGPIETYPLSPELFEGGLGTTPVVTDPAKRAPCFLWRGHRLVVGSGAVENCGAATADLLCLPSPRSSGGRRGSPRDPRVRRGTSASRGRGAGRSVSNPIVG